MNANIVAHIETSHQQFLESLPTADNDWLARTIDNYARVSTRLSDGIRFQPLVAAKLAAAQAERRNRLQNTA